MGKIKQQIDRITGSKTSSRSAGDALTKMEAAQPVSLTNNAGTSTPVTMPASNTKPNKEAD